MSPPRRSETISPTAYATGYMWYRLGLSHPALVTRRGRLYDGAFQLLMRAARPLSGVFPFDNLMLSRHHGIDALLTRAIEDGRVGQVIEIAAGLSGRGWRLMRQYGERLSYIETDLPAMAATKRRLLQNAGLLGPRHRVQELDALADEGPTSLAALVRTLDPKIGTAIITEGLMNYLPPELAQGVWRRIAAALKLFPQGLYLADAYLARETRTPAARLFRKMLSTFVRGSMHIHFETPEHGMQLMRQVGFRYAIVHAPADLPETRVLARKPGGNHVRILEART